MEKRVYNFSAGPACLPLEVLKAAQSEFISYADSGMNVMEMSHRGKIFEGIIKKAESDLRELMGIPDSYSVLFLQGGASLQFHMIPLNLITKHHKVHFVDTGIWATRAIKEVEKTATANVVASSKDTTYTYIPELTKDMFTQDADYVHIASNNTIFGTRFTKRPDTNGLPLVSDMSSYILSEVIEVTDYDLIFAGAQKNIGPAGVTIVIIKNELIEKAPDNLPTMLAYKTHAEKGSLFNTPPTYSVYLAGKVFEWLLDNGGVAAMQATNEKKAKLLYDFLDASSLFNGLVKKEDRSMMNVTFATGDADMDKAFIVGAEERDLLFLKGHRLSGGMRASIYNAMPYEGVAALVDYMKEFEKNA
ncbi:MAG: 3-phosphoserine/phosphohydroxythreonine transaminase [Eubacteriales bacterium]